VFLLMFAVMMAGILSAARKTSRSISGGRSTSSTSFRRLDVIVATIGKMSKVGLLFGLHVPLITCQSCSRTDLHLCAYMNNF